MKVFFTTAIILFSLCGFAQTEEYGKIPLSPNAASLAQYGSSPVGLYTGTAQYSIPLYTVQGRNLSVPITLNYSTNGIQVEDISPWVGAGWSLDAGGLISRTVKGNPDELATDTPPDIDPSCLDYENCYKLETPTYDMEYDSFSYNFMGNTGTFIIVDGEVKLIDDNGFRFEVAPGWLGFIVTDNNGIKYYFGRNFAGEANVDPLEYTQVGLDGHLVKTSWYLSKIEHWSGEQIIFAYGGSFQPTYNIGFNQTMSRQLPTEDPCAVCPFPEPNWSHLSDVNKSTYRHNNIFLKRIFCTNLYDEAIFVGSAYTLESIIGKTKKIDFDIIPHGITNHRLYLKKLSFLTLDDIEGETYKFDYIDEGDVPARATFMRDFWGYYNGQNNTNFVTGNHKPYPDFAEKGSLQKITYPTGGYTIIDYEGNSTPDGDCLSELDLPEIKHWHTGGANSQPELIDPYEFTVPFEQDVTFTLAQEYYPDPTPNINSSNEGSATFSITSLYPSPLYSHTFPQPGFDNGTRDLAVHLQAGTYQVNLTVESDIYRAAYKFKICEEKGTIFGGIRVKDTKTYSAQDVLALSKSYEYDMPHMASPQRFSTLYYMAATHICATPPPFQNTPPSYIPFCMKYIQSSTGPTSMIGAAGNAFYGAVTEHFMQDSISKYSIRHVFDSAPYKSPPEPNSVSCDMTENPVTEYFGKPYETETDYYKINNAGLRVMAKKEVFNYERPILNTYKSYLLTRKTFGINAYDYMEAGDSCAINLLPLGRKMRLSQYTYVCFWQKLASKVTMEYTYDDSSPAPLVLAEIITNKSNFYYDNPVHKQLTRQENMISEAGPVLETIKYTYPDDVSSVNSLYGGAIIPQQLAAIRQLDSDPLHDHRTSTPLVIERLDNSGNHIETTRYLFRNFSFPDSEDTFSLPWKVQFLKGDTGYGATMHDKQIFSAYNRFNLKPQQITGPDGINPQSYLYGYDHRYLIAVVKNKLFDDDMWSLYDEYSIGEHYPDLDDLYSELSGIPNTMPTIYSYVRLIGVSSITDSKGDIVKYHYDGFGRLGKVTDKDGNILSENTYHFRP